MVRPLLFVTVLALGGAAFIAFSNVQGEIDRITDERDTAQTNLDRTNGELADAKDAQKLAEDDRKKAQEDAKKAMDRLEDTQQALAVQRKRADDHEADADKFEADLVKATNFVQSWELFQQANGRVGL